mmetsp:Transcript_86542/g.217941  ORF Transcript_86542/g.217941 Transcript_86542/m.217941 type:complete len:226 (+) Transcript_86542:232-909(+)
MIAESQPNDRPRYTRTRSPAQKRRLKRVAGTQTCARDLDTSANWTRYPVTAGQLDCGPLTTAGIQTPTSGSVQTSTASPSATRRRSSLISTALRRCFHPAPMRTSYISRFLWVFRQKVRAMIRAGNHILCDWEKYSTRSPTRKPQLLSGPGAEVEINEAKEVAVCRTTSNSSKWMVKSVSRSWPGSLATSNRSSAASASSSPGAAPSMAALALARPPLPMLEART